MNAGKFRIAFSAISCYLIECVCMRIYRFRKGGAAVKRLATFFLLLGLLCCLLPCMTPDTHAASSYYVSSLEEEHVLDKYGTCRSTLNITVDFGSGCSDFRIPVGSSIRNISVSGGNFRKRTSGGVHWLVLRDPEAYQGEHTFTVSYTKARLISVNADRSQTMTLPLLVPYWSCRIDKLHFSVSLPEEFPGKPEYVSGYYGDGASVSDKITGSTIEGDVLSSMMDREAVDLQLPLPARYYSILHSQGNFAKITSALILILSVVALAYWLYDLRNPFPKAGDRKMPPDGVGAWEFPFVSSSGRSELPLLIFEWANRGYVSIRQNSHGRITIEKEMEMSTERRPQELNAFNTMFEKGDSFNADTAAFAQLSEQAANDSEEYWNPRLFAEKSGNPVLLHLFTALILGFSWMRCMDFLTPPWILRFFVILPMLVFGFAAGYLLQLCIQSLLRRQTRYLIPAILLIAIAIRLMDNDGGFFLPLIALAMQFFSAIATYRGGKRTETGMSIVSQIRAFRKDLRSTGSRQFQLMLNRDPQYFYRMLPYAEILGFGRKFAASFENIRLEQCPWFKRDGAAYLVAADFYPYFRDALRRMRRRSRRQVRKKRS